MFTSNYSHTRTDWQIHNSNKWLCMKKKNYFVCLPEKQFDIQNSISCFINCSVQLIGNSVYVISMRKKSQKKNKICIQVENDGNTTIFLYALVVVLFPLFCWAYVIRNAYIKKRILCIVYNGSVLTLTMKFHIVYKYIHKHSKAFIYILLLGVCCRIWWYGYRNKSKNMSIVYCIHVKEQQ